MDGASTVRKFEFDKIYIGIVATNYMANLASYYTEGDSIFVTSKQGGYGIGLPFQIKPNTTYTIINPTKETISIAEYDKDGNWLQWENDYFTEKYSFTTSTKTEVLLLVLRPDHDDSREYKNIQFYEEPIVNIYLDEPLRKVGEDADYIDFKTGKVVRKIVKYEFTGQEIWSGGYTGEDDWGGKTTVGFYQYTRGINSKFLFGETIYPKEGSSTLNNYFEHINNIYAYHNLQGENYASAETRSYYAMRINRDVLATYGTDNNSDVANIAAFTAFIKEKYDANNPVTVFYAIEKPSEDTIGLPELPAFEDDTKIEVLTTVAPSKIEAEYEGYTIE